LVTVKALSSHFVVTFITLSFNIFTYGELTLNSFICQLCSSPFFKYIIADPAVDSFLAYTALTDSSLIFLASNTAFTGFPFKSVLFNCILYPTGFTIAIETLCTFSVISSNLKDIILNTSSNEYFEVPNFTIS